MRAFIRLTGFAAPLPIANIDTDKILPGAFLKTVTRDGLGKALFAAMRYQDDGTEREDFVLNRAPWRRATILIAWENFGCGSSREHAPWALVDFGITCIIAPSFADIFRNNCFKNGILPITLDRDTIERLMERAGDPATASLAIDLETQTITLADGGTIGFTIEAERKIALMQGLDEIAQSLARADDIAAFEAAAVATAPWTYDGVADRLAGVVVRAPAGDAVKGYRFNS